MTRTRPLRRPSVAALVSALVVGLLGVAAPSATAAPPPPTPAARPTDPIAHDPTLAREGDWYYVAITGDAGPDDTYIPLKRSRDLVHWEELGPVFTELQPWVLEALGVTAANAPRDAWAPDLTWSGTEWRLYYSVSQFGTNNSVIGLMTTPSLAEPDWQDQGLVVRSEPGAQPDNAIDPNLVVDADGATWLAFGSFFSGIQLVRLDPATGKVAAGAEPVQIARRSTGPNAQENPTIVHRDGYYYLFLSFDFCCRGVESDYRTVVGRSADVAGPYLDADGVPLLDDKGGTEVMRGYNEFVGAGGADVLLTGEDTGLVVNHYYDATDGAAPRLNVRTLSWTADGWPVVSEPLNPSRSIGHGEAFVQIVPRGASTGGQSTVVENAGCGFEGANIALWTDLDNTCQQWQLSARDDGGTRITNRFSNAVAEVAGCRNVDGGNVAQWGWLGFLESNDCQRWSLTSTADGWTTVASVLPGGRAWTVQGAATPGANVAISTPTGGTDQQFRFEPVGDVLLASPTDMTTTLGVNGCKAGRGNGNQVRFDPRDPAGCQTWQLRSIPGTATVQVVSPDSGKVLASTACLHRGAADKLRVVDTRSPSAGRCSAWTLAPTDDGTWTLATAGTTREVRVLIP
ncbi:family 43 glycosylhydrolase [uncultured Cellulomonas sp.]|uniref:family 43 glycosylhydrolase n=1 Tax=uncultured Cellulomonas sp. TaxID=189682 RepID=UPI00260B98CC|nr:family 43 glycosylhydrolase [uncultured Cellulomonas sp.]